jgi:hypothetical protein
MNDELIDELAAQAGEYANAVHTAPVRSKTPGKIWEDGHIQWHTHYDRKFAELIVRECVQVGGPEDSYTDEWFKAKADSMAKIKQHFRVEE